MITVITRTSNRPRYFANCRKSVLAQTRPCFHLIISDDPADAYPEGDKVVRLPIRSEGRGVNQYFNWVFQHIPAAPLVITRHFSQACRSSGVSSGVST